MPRCWAYSRMRATWLCVEYCWCSVDIRTYSAARKFDCPFCGNGRSPLSIVQLLNRLVVLRHEVIGYLETSPWSATATPHYQRHHLLAMKSSLCNHTSPN